MEGTGLEWSGGKGRGGQSRVPDCLGGLSRVGISSRSTRPWNGQPPSIITGVSLEFHVAGISNVTGGTLAGHVPGLEICGILVANATMFSHLLPGFSCGSKHLLLP